MAEPRYYSLNQYFHQVFGRKIYKIALDAGFTCPNRDGTCGTSGCAFCGDGSGTFAEPNQGESRQLDAQIQAAIRRVEKKSGNEDTGYMGYFQAYTNTYAPADRLRDLYMPVLLRPEIVGLSIATRPDCLPGPVLELLAELNQIKPVWVELGLQTIHDETAEAFGRGYSSQVFYDAVTALSQMGIETIVHLIFGLPGESQAMMLETLDRVTRLPIKGLKLQMLHILEGTPYADLYRTGHIKTYSEEEWIDWICFILPLIPDSVVIHRLTGDGPKSLLLAPAWSADKRHVLNHLQRELEQRGIRQGSQINTCILRS